MAVPEIFRGKLKLPVLGAPMFIVSQPELVTAQCRAGIVGSFPTLNARKLEDLESWLQQFTAVSKESGAAPFGANLIVHKSNSRLAADTDLVIKYRVPYVITSVGDPTDVVRRVHEYGGIVFHDVINLRHAKKAMSCGVDGLILVCAGAGGHGGTLSPFAFVSEVRSIFSGAISLAGAISTGAHVRAAIAMGADLASMGTRFIATKEAKASDAYKQMIVDSGSADILYTPYFSGVNANFLRGSVEAGGFEPADVMGKRESASLAEDLSHAEDGGPKAWKDIWSAGQGVGAIHDVPPVADLVTRLKAEYDAAP